MWIVRGENGNGPAEQYKGVAHGIASKPEDDDRFPAVPIRYLPDVEASAQIEPSASEPASFSSRAGLLCGSVA